MRRQLLFWGHYFPQDSVRLQEMANEAGISRIFGGINYFYDNENGKMCGEKIGKVAVNWGKQLFLQHKFVKLPNGIYIYAIM